MTVLSRSMVPELGLEIAVDAQIEDAFHIGTA